LLNFQIIKYIIDGLSRKIPGKYFYQITTNGYCLTEEMIEYLAQHMSSISISLDGNEETNDINRVSKEEESTFATVFKNAKFLREKFEDMEVRMTVDAETCGYLSKNIFFLLKEGFTRINAEVDCSDERWTVEAVDYLERECRTVKNVLADNDYKNRITLPIGYKAFNKTCCTGGIDSYHIDPNGNIYPCSVVLGDVEMCMGNVCNGIIAEKMEELERIAALKIPVCEGCGGYESCINVRCRLINKKIMGDYISPVPLVCELHRRNLVFHNI